MPPDWIVATLGNDIEVIPVQPEKQLGIPLNPTLVRLGNSIPPVRLLHPSKQEPMPPLTIFNLGNEMEVILVLEKQEFMPRLTLSNLGNDTEVKAIGWLENMSDKPYSCIEVIDPKSGCSLFNLESDK